MRLRPWLIRTCRHVIRQRVVKQCLVAGFSICIASATCTSRVLTGQSSETKYEVATIPEGLLRKFAEKVVMPKYPRSSSRKRTSGIVVGTVEVNEKGEVTSVKVAETPNQEIGLAAMDAIQQWRFRPAGAEGKPVRLRSVLTFYFV